VSFPPATAEVPGGDWAILVLTHEGLGWNDGHRFLDPDPNGPAVGDALGGGEGREYLRDGGTREQSKEIRLRS